jgi:hypothetical protein
METGERLQRKRSWGSIDSVSAMQKESQFVHLASIFPKQLNSLDPIVSRHSRAALKSISRFENGDRSDDL